MDFPIYHRQDSACAGWQVEQQQRLLSNPWINVDAVRVLSPGRPEGVDWTVARRRNAVVVAPRLEDGRYLLIRQERFPIERAIWEFPAGMIDDLERAQQVETIVRFAEQELQEETAHRLCEGARMQHLGHYFSSPGFWDEHAYQFLATAVEPMEQPQRLGESTESIFEARAFSAVELKRMVADGELVDSNTLSLYARLVAQDLL